MIKTNMSLKCTSQKEKKKEQLCIVRTKRLQLFFYFTFTREWWKVIGLIHFPKLDPKYQNYSWKARKCFVTLSYSSPLCVTEMVAGLLLVLAFVIGVRNETVFQNNNFPHFKDLPKKISYLYIYVFVKSELQP